MTAKERTGGIIVKSLKSVMAPLAFKEKLSNEFKAEKKNSIKNKIPDSDFAAKMLVESPKPASPYWIWSFRHKAILFKNTSFPKGEK